MDRVAPESHNALMVSTTLTNKASITRKAGVFLMQEIFKDIPGYEGLYQVSNLGRVKSFKKSNRYPNQDFHYLKGSVNHGNYKSVWLCDKNNNNIRHYVHKLVANAFIPNPNNLPCINHIDEDKSNNAANNLEWCSYSYNNSYGTHNIRMRISKSKPVSQFTLDGIWVATYASSTIATEILKCNRNAITRCCNGETKTAKGYIWKWANESKNT